MQRPGQAIPPGVLVGLAMSIKLTPGVFVIHYLVNRRWKEAATAVGTAVAVTLGSWVLLPEASFAFWGGALQDPARLGPNAGTANQSIRGFLLRVGPDGLAGTAKELADAGKVKVGVKADQPNLGFKDPTTNEFEGFDIEIAKMIAADLGIAADDIEFVEVPSVSMEPDRKPECSP